MTIPQMLVLGLARRCLLDDYQGTCDKMEQLLSKELPEYNYNYLTANYARIVAEISQQKPILCACLVKTPERQNYIEYSILAQLSLPNGIIIQKSDYDKFKPFINSEGRANLEKLINESQLILGYSIGRAYSGIIDRIIHENLTSPNLYGRSGTDQFQGLVQMMRRKHVDYILGFPQEVIQFGSIDDAKRKLSFFPVDGMPDYLGVYIGGPKNEWGKRVIAKINAVLLRKRHTQEVLSYYDFWVDDNSVKFHHKLAKELFGK